MAMLRRAFHRACTARMSHSQPTNWKTLAPAPPAGTATFDAQSSLPPLPVPDLGATLTRLKETLRPLAWSAEELAATEAKIEQFASGQGRELHERLLARAKEHKHWLEEWWDNGAYLGYRESVVVNVSYYYGFDNASHAEQQSPVARAACLARETMLFRQLLKTGKLTPDATRDGPLCMDTFRWMFDCCRLPGPDGLDWSVSYANPGDTGTEDAHIVVFRNNLPWKVTTALNGRILGTSEIEQQIQHIWDHSAGTHPGVGVLPASDRDFWASARTSLASSPHNASILHTIQSAAFTISLDASAPITPEHHSRALWHGDLSPAGVPVGLQNRWVDKPVQYIVFDNAVAGLMGEHSVMDGTPTVRLADDVLRALASPRTSSDETPDSGPARAVLPTALKWELSPRTQADVEEANARARALIEGQELGFVVTAYGKAAIKRFGVSPDSWAQMIVQLAYARLLRLSSDGGRRMGGTYEAATTRRFFKGRTEAIRVVSVESDKWVASMDDDAVAQQERKVLFDEAVKVHGARARAAGMGQGVDRHLFGLKKLVKVDKGETLPALFTDPLFVRSSNWVLSTSAVFSKHFAVYGWGEVVPEGFGVAYVTGFDDRLQYTITSRKESPNAQFCEEIRRAAGDLYALHAGLADVKAKL